MRTALILVIVMLTGCGSTAVPEQHFYLVRSVDAASGEVRHTGDFGVRRVEVASYLEQAGVILEVSDGELRPARYHLWAEPLRESIRRFLVSGLTARLEVDMAANRRTRNNVDVVINELHGNTEGDVTLSATWRITNLDGVMAAHQLSESAALTEDGYAALTRAHEALLDRLADAIAASVSELESAP